MSEHLKMLAGGWTSVMGHEMGFAKPGANMADLVESVLLRAIKQGHNDALEAAAKACEAELAFNPDDPGETYARVVRALKAT